MPKIITVTDLQKNIGKLMEFVSGRWTIVTSRGKARVVMLPYFDDNDASIEEYLEDYEMHLRGTDLRKRYVGSLQSGISDLAA